MRLRSCPTIGITKTSSPTGSAIGYRITRKLDEVQSPFQKIEIFEIDRLGQPDADRRRDDADHARQFLLPRDDVAPGAVHACGSQARRDHRRRRLRHAARSAQAPGRGVAPCSATSTSRSRAWPRSISRSCAIPTVDPRAALLFDDGIAYIGQSASRQRRRDHRRLHRSRRPGRRPVQQGVLCRVLQGARRTTASSCSSRNRRWCCWT